MPAWINADYYASVRMRKRDMRYSVSAAIQLLRDQ